jgi:hypothetical protein
MKNKLLILVIGAAVLLIFQAKVLMPVIYDIVATDLFLEDSGDDPNRISTSTEMTGHAFTQCNKYISTEMFSDYQFIFSDKPTSSFGLGNFEYIISAMLDVQPEGEASYTKKYSCRIKYDDQDDIAGINDLDNWSVNGVGGLNDL